MKKLKQFCLFLMAGMAMMSCSDDEQIKFANNKMKLAISTEQIEVTQTKTIEQQEDIEYYAIQIYEKIEGEDYKPKYHGIFDGYNLNNIEFSTRNDAVYKIECAYLFNNGKSGEPIKDIATDVDGNFMEPFTMSNDKKFPKASMNVLIEDATDYFIALNTTGVREEGMDKASCFSNYYRFYGEEEDIADNVGQVDIVLKAKCYFLDINTHGIPEGYMLRACLQNVEDSEDVNLQRSRMEELANNNIAEFFANDMDFSHNTESAVLKTAVEDGSQKVYLYLSYGRTAPRPRSNNKTAVEEEEDTFIEESTKVVELNVKRLHKHIVDIKINQNLGISLDGAEIIVDENVVTVDMTPEPMDL